MFEAHGQPEPTLQATALRYAAGDLTPDEAAAFEARLAHDQEARDALSEAVRLSAAALGQPAPGAHRSFRAAIRERLAGWCPSWLARRAYRGHPLAWAGIGAASVAACTLVGLSLAEPDRPTGDRPPPAAALAPAPRPAEPAPAAPAHHPHDADAFVAATPGGSPCGDSVAEIWANLSGTESVEKAHDEEMKWRHKLRDAGSLHPARPVHADADRPQPE
jgi:hypothetical protein